jgi:hypothetical protein
MPPELASLPAFPWLLAAWLFALGAAIGSFLNVVVYRVPAGLSLVHPPSHCPACKHPIRWRDNLPILGWLILRGRCRDCGVKISPRYPAVEAITAGLFLLIAIVEINSLCANLPQRPIAVPDGVLYPASSLAESLAAGLYHLALLTTLWAAALVEYDGHRASWRLAIPALVVGGLAPLVWPPLHPVAAWGMSDSWMAGLTDSLVGLGVGLTLGIASQRLLASHGRMTLAIAPACVGLFLGWQAVAVLAVVVLPLHLATWTLGRIWPKLQRITPGMWWLVLAVAWIALWRPLLAAFAGSGVV